MKLFRIHIPILATLLTAFTSIACKSGSDSDKYADSKAGYSPEKNIVDVMLLKKQPFSYQLISNGRLAAEKCTLKFPGDGIIIYFPYRNGDKVTKGDTIAVLDSREQQIAYESAAIALRKAELDLFDVLAGQGYDAKDTVSVPEEIMEMAKMRSGYDAALNTMHKAGMDLDGCTLTAPFSGKIADISVGRHDYVSAADEICSIISDDNMMVEFTVLESEYPILEKGLVADIVPYADKSMKTRGIIESVNPAVDRNGQIKVMASVKNNGKLIDGMNVRITVNKEMTDNFVVPKNAVVIRDNENVIFRYGNGKAQWTYVNILMSNSESHAITANDERGSEIHEGDTVIISGNLNLADGSQVEQRR